MDQWVPTSLEGIRFSRYPLAPALIAVSASDGLPELRVVGRALEQAFELQFSDLERGHVVEAMVWYAIDSELAREILELTRNGAIGVGPIRSLKTLLELRRAAEAGGPVEYQLAGDALSPLALIAHGGAVPAGVAASLYAYQVDGWRWLKFVLGEGVGGLLADEMGLGKTLQVIALLCDHSGVELLPALIVAPGTLLENWGRELDKFAPDLTWLRHHGPNRTGRPADLSQFKVVLTSYDTAVSDSSLLNMVEWGVVVLDEAQAIRNPDAQRTRAVKRLRRRVALAVTGTPIENRLLDVWSIFDFIAPGHLPADARSFQALYGDGAEGAALLESQISPLLLRRRVSEVARDLPSRIDIPAWVELDGEYLDAYEQIRESAASEAGTAGTLVALTRLRQFCAHPALLVGAETRKRLTEFSKFQRMHDIVEEIMLRREKVIIFTSFLVMADLIVQHIKDAFGVFAESLDGRTALSDRQTALDRFGRVAGGAALVLNPKVGGAGLNITAANHVIHYNPEWNPALEDQASARAYRRGQSLPVSVYTLLVADTVDEVIAERLARKRALADRAVVGVEGKDEDYGDIVAALARTPAARPRR